jgi:hypothetical protein
MSALEEQVKQICNQVFDERKSELAPSSKINSPWMTEMQLAQYWHLYNKTGQLTTESIRKWSARAESDHPLPCGNVGDLRRYHRDEVDQWAREEAALQRAKRTAKRAAKSSEAGAPGMKGTTGYLKAVESAGRK